MEKSFSIFGHRRQIIEDNLELLLELDRILYDPEGLPYVLERHEQMTRQSACAREEIALAVAGDVEGLSRVGVRFLAVF